MPGSVNVDRSKLQKNIQDFALSLQNDITKKCAIPIIYTKDRFAEDAVLDRVGQKL
jgi:hypothetical protein